MKFGSAKGITPAHAGKRNCGSNDALRTMGSPPHMRGKVRQGRLPSHPRGITPAHAGKRDADVIYFTGGKDHPRTCGEKPIQGHYDTSSVGSPPHMRGKGHRRPKSRGWMRITPAHAGKRLKRSRSIVPHAAIVPLFPSVCNKPAGSDGSPAGHDAPPFLPIENAVPASPAYNLRSL